MAADAASFSTTIDSMSLIVKGAPGTPSTTHSTLSFDCEPIPRMVTVGAEVGPPPLLTTVTPGIWPWRIPSTELIGRLLFCSTLLSTPTEVERSALRAAAPKPSTTTSSIVCASSSSTMSSAVVAFDTATSRVT